MTSTKQIDFLSKPSTDRLRKEIRNICDSYSNPWDILAELCQNSVDAVRRFSREYTDVEKKYEIEITIDSPKRIIKVRDNGCGFSTEKIEHLLAPHGTDKADDFEEIGEKGIGLTYTIFCCNKFRLRAESKSGKIDGTVNGSAAWKSGVEGVEIPKFNGEVVEENGKDPLDFYTEVELIDVEKVFSEDADLFSQKIPVIEYILRTKTAIGDVRKVFGISTPNVEAKLIHINQDGEKKEVPIPFEYKLPTEHVAAKDILDLRQFVVEAASLSDAQKARKLHNKLLETSGDIEHSNRKIRYKAIFVPKRDVWETISKRAGLDPEGFYNYRGGLWFVTKGMPTGVEISPPSAGAAGYWPNFYLLIEDSGVVFDLGRKAIPGRTLGFLRNHAKMVFNKFTKFQHYFKGEPETRSGPAQIHGKTIEKRFEELMGATDLELGKISYLKHPNRQEAAVVAIFHELVGANVLKGYYGLQSSYRSSYDFWCKYRIPAEEVGSDHRDKCENGVLDLNTVIEFKHDGENIIRDLDERRKYFEDITLLVCWDFDQKAFSDRQINVRMMKDHERVFDGSNIVLEFPGTYNLGAAGQKHVLVLRQFIQDYISSHRKANK